MKYENGIYVSKMATFERLFIGLVRGARGEIGGYSLGGISPIWRERKPMAFNIPRMKSRRRASVFSSAIIYVSPLLDLRLCSEFYARHVHAIHPKIQLPR